MNPLLYMMVACSIARARNPHDLMKLGMIALTLMSMEDTEWMPASSSSWSNRKYLNGMRRKIGFYLLSSLRIAPTGDLDHHQCPLIDTIEKGSDQESRQTFRVSRFVFAAILNELKADLQDGFSRNRGQYCLLSCSLLYGTRGSRNASEKGVWVERCHSSEVCICGVETD
jgi:hypothetical protein